jgi:hypothetical protein
MGPRVGYDHCLPNAFQLILLLSSDKTILYSFDTEKASLCSAHKNETTPIMNLLKLLGQLMWIFYRKKRPNVNFEVA